MASVRMTKDLRAAIQAKANCVFDKAEAKVTDPPDSMLADKIAREYFDNELAETMQYLPGSWKAVANHLQVAVNYIDNDGDVVKHHFYEYLKNQLTVPNLNDLIEVNANQISLVIPDDYRFSTDTINTIMVWRNKLDKVLDERMAFENEIRRILERCNTLKQFFDIWPQGENLVPPAEVYKLTAATSTKKKEIILSDEVAQELSTSLLKQTLINS